MAYKAQKQHAPIDDNVHLPAAIRAASMRSDEIHKQAYNTPDAPVVEELKPITNPPVAEVIPPEPAKPAAEAPKPGDPEFYKHQYDSLKGRYDQQDRTIQNLTRQMEDLRVAQSRAAAPAPTPANPDLQFKFKPISAEERETYGEDFIDVAGRAAAAQFEPVIKSLRDELDSLKGNVRQVGEVTARSTHEKMLEYLDGQLDTWTQINRDPKFLAWVALPNPYSGAIRVVEMRDAYSKGEGQRVLQFFKGFLSDEAAMAPAPLVQPDDPNKDKVPLSDFAAPGRAKAPAASVPPGEKETISRSQIANFFNLVQKGHYRGNEKEKDRLEAMIFAAQAEGRVTD